MDDERFTSREVHEAYKGTIKKLGRPGFSFWKDEGRVSSSAKSRYAERLHGKLPNRGEDIDRGLRSPAREYGGTLVPLYPPTSHIHMAFLDARWDFRAESVHDCTSALILYLIRKPDPNSEIAAVRFEIGEAGQSHDYWHAQWTSIANDKYDAEDAGMTGSGVTFPSYPAFPICAANVLQALVCVVWTLRGTNPDVINTIRSVVRGVPGMVWDDMVPSYLSAKESRRK